MKYTAHNTQQKSNFSLLKKSILVLAIVFGFQMASAQQFNATEDYYVSFQGQLNEEGEVLQSALLMTNNKNPLEITSFPIADAQMIHNITVYKLENPGLHGVKSVLKVNVQYTEYCTYNVDNYILETDKGGYISLPILTNEDCGDSASEMVYLFPSQKFGKNNKILTSQITLNANAIVDAEQEDSFIWNDEHYGTSGRLYEDF